MHGLGIQSTMSHYRPKKPMTITDTPQKPNLMRNLNDLSGVVTTDITYIQLTSKKWVYVATAYDPEHRKVLAFQVTEHMTAELAVGSIKQLINQQYRFKIVHSDMGSQYTSTLFEGTLNQASLTHSYSRKGHPCDNGRLEAYHSLLKKELINQHTYATLNEIRLAMRTYNHFYNTEREINGRGSYKPKKRVA